MMQKKKKTFRRRAAHTSRPCYLCVTGMKDIDFRDTELLQKFLSSFLKIAPRRRSGLCALHQRKVAKAVKRAREMSLIAYTPN